jgi:hypothetical protein
MGERARKNPGTFDSKAAAKKYERAIQYFKRHYGEAASFLVQILPA